jgi:hypothetical protein
VPEHRSDAFGVAQSKLVHIERLASHAIRIMRSIDYRNFSGLDWIGLDWTRGWAMALARSIQGKDDLPTSGAADARAHPRQAIAVPRAVRS